MILKAYGKINLSLDVISRREDGYHNLRMIMQNIELHDVISVMKTTDKIKLTCSRKELPIDKKNLAYRAAELFIDNYNVRGGVEIHIEKNIPMAAGLAGGSTDAAAVLRAMRSLYRPEIEDAELMELGLSIGADVPYCIVGGTALCEGIGEKVTKLKSFKNHILVLVKPSFGVSTKEVYESLKVDNIAEHPDTEFLIRSVENNDLASISSNMKNVLEEVTLKKHTVLKEIKEEAVKMGALGSLMSGSGPTVFAFFDDMLKAQMYYDRMKKSYEEVFITRTI
ncbi:4-(cytidine 5'-diphospho)-2-C-methyl-D-erythritol kinase [Clostridium sp. A1-XYC3]|uniref:4-diphosphocytidyl-2-C-methyl-D-erythritol kinase n=1 Tax=Clostridium tanneri TaxID=3037988 RepID=A0ABU4JR61_9CLOT|nr:4-(cytidine 5'-diphospho)-2-C-methyl-D-erythritol kinase [Clostridium sp. A1-XYC3]MDW8800630.1 4-(cytidine 5'-diphospho)-2-C-methyl-D-erythritol kinase [Clostridium sp. A1-XYC3]